MRAWTIEELQTWLKKFDDPNSSMNYFLDGPSDESIKEARALLKEKLALRGVVEHE